MILNSNDTLFERIIKSGVWVAAWRIIERGLKVVSIVILARFITPSEFGLYGIAVLVISALKVFSQIGFKQALIQRKKNTTELLNTTWTIQIIRGVLITITLFIGAPYIALFFNTPSATKVLQAISISAFFQGFSNIGTIYFQKELKFHKHFLYMVSGTIIEACVSIAIAIILKNVWALVFGLLAGDFTRMIMSFCLHPYRPKLSFKKKVAVELFDFGKWILGINIFSFFSEKGADIIIGKLLGKTQLGFYQMAIRFSSPLLGEIPHVVAQVTFPAYSSLQYDNTRLKRAFIVTLSSVLNISVPLSMGIFLLAPDLVRIFLGDVWLPMVSVLQISMVIGIFHNIIITGDSLFKAVGRPNISFWMRITLILGMISVSYPLAKRYGIDGIALAILFGYIISFFIWWHEVNRVIVGMWTMDFWYEVGACLWGVAVMSISIIGYKIMQPSLNVFQMVILINIAIVSYLCSEYFYWKKYHAGFWKLLSMFKIVLYKV